MNSSKTKKTVTFPNGEKTARNTAKDYKFAVCVQYSDTFYSPMWRGAWYARSWHTRLELAEREAQKLQDSPSYANVAVLPVS